MKLFDSASNLETLCVHAGAEPDPLTGAVMAPVYFTSTYAQSAPGKHKGYEYSRTKNPTRDRLEAALAALEGGSRALAFASGLAAEDAVLHLLRPGDNILVCQDLYGGTFRLMRRVWENYGLKFSFIDTTQTKNVAGALNSTTRLVWIETPSNPLLSISDIKSIAGEVKKNAPKALVCVDNTFATPILQQPLSLGADIVVHSTTKYIGGHSDIIGGAVVVRDPQLAESLAFYQNAVGAVPGPMDCFLTHRGLKTLALRMMAHCENAGQAARYLVRHPKVRKVHYPGIPRHPGHALVKTQMNGFGGMVSFELKGDVRKTNKFFSRLKLITVGESLGGVESLACYPWVMTHASIPEDQRRAAGVTENLVRLSLGIEKAHDLIDDLKQALTGL